MRGPGSRLLLCCSLFSLVALTWSASEEAHAQSTGSNSTEAMTVHDGTGTALKFEDVISPGPTLVVFWRADSRPSREAVVHLHQCGAQMKTRGVRVIAVSPSDSDCASAGEFLDSQAVGFRNLCDSEGHVAAHFGLGSIYPGLLLFDDDGRLVDRAEGGGDSFDANLARLLDRVNHVDRPTASTRWWVAAALVAVMILGMAIGQ